MNLLSYFIQVLLILVTAPATMTNKKPNKTDNLAHSISYESKDEVSYSASNIRKRAKTNTGTTTTTTTATYPKSTKKQRKYSLSGTSKREKNKAIEKTKRRVEIKMSSKSKPSANKGHNSAKREHQNIPFVSLSHTGKYTHKSNVQITQDAHVHFSKRPYIPRKKALSKLPGFKPIGHVFGFKKHKSKKKDEPAAKKSMRTHDNGKTIHLATMEGYETVHVPALPGKKAHAKHTLHDLQPSTASITPTIYYGIEEPPIEKIEPIGGIEPINSIDFMERIEKIKDKPSYDRRFNENYDLDDDSDDTFDGDSKSIIPAYPGVSNDAIDLVSGSQAIRGPPFQQTIRSLSGEEAKGITYEATESATRVKKQATRVEQQATRVKEPATGVEKEATGTKRNNDISFLRKNTRNNLSLKKTPALKINDNKKTRRLKIQSIRKVMLQFPKLQSLNHPKLNTHKIKMIETESNVKSTEKLRMEKVVSQAIPVIKEIPPIQMQSERFSI